jgi:polysaccharide export outer membrane protein
MSRFKSSQKASSAIIACALALPLAACAPGVFLPESGPTRHAILSGATYQTVHVAPNKDLPYVLVTLNSETVPRLPPDNGGSLDFPLSNARRSDGLIGVGDLLGVTIFESGSGGLFLPREPGTRTGNFVPLPTQQVDQMGNIVVPYGGTIRAAGRSPAQVQKEIQERLAARALEPQVVVSIIDRRADAVTVLGDITSAAHFSLDPGGERLLGAVARAGGPKFPSYESVVTVQRNGQSRRTLLSDIEFNPRQNIEIKSGDSIIVTHEPRYFLALGASGLAGGLGLVDRRISFSDYHISLADAIAKSGGVQDALAHAQGVFVYREEPRENVLALGVDPNAPLPARVPTVYAVDLTEPAGFFHARQFMMHNEDLMYVSNAPATDVNKFLSTILSPLTSSSAAARATGN